MFLVASAALWPDSDSESMSSRIRQRCTFTSAAFKSHTEWSEAMHNVSAHQLPQYYQPQQVPSTA